MVAADDAPAIVVAGAVKRYAGRPVVDRLSFTVRPGEIVALLGPNGAGKTTTVEMLEGYRAPDEGTVRVLGLDPVRDGAALKPRIGIMLQQGGVYPQARPLEALRLFASLFANPEDPEALLRQVGLAEARQTRFRQLSGGQKQRLALALALVGRPEVVFLDEPTTAMDPAARRATWQLILDLRRRGVTALLTTHFMEEAERLADRVVIVDRGQLVALGSPEQLARQSAAREIRFCAPPGLPVADLAARLAARAVVEEQPGRYRLEAEASPRLLAELAAWLAERDALLTSLGVERRSLEDVYLRLTAAGTELPA